VGECFFRYPSSCITYSSDMDRAYSYNPRAHTPHNFCSEKYPRKKQTLSALSAITPVNITLGRGACRLTLGDLASTTASHFLHLPPAATLCSSATCRDGVVVDFGGWKKFNNHKYLIKFILIIIFSDTILYILYTLSVLCAL